MSKVTASTIQAAATLVNAEIILTDGRYEQWEAAFMQQLNAGAIAKWESEGWTYDKVANLHVLTLKIQGKKTSVALRFGTAFNTGNYKLDSVVLYADGERHPFRIAKGKGLPGNAPVVLNNKDLLAILQPIDGTFAAPLQPKKN